LAKLDDELTPVSPSDVAAALTTAWSALFGADAHRTSILVLLSQWALETGRGASMHCYNLGNVKSDQKAGDWCFFRCDEVLNGKVVWFEPDDPACCFRAFKTLADGATDYLTTLRRRFDVAWPAVVAGDPATFVHLLKQAKYFTADETQYTNTVVALFNEFSRTLPMTPGGGAASGPDLFSVKGIQTALASLGFDPGVADGTLGPNTAAAVKQFQSAHGLVADGQVGALTRQALAAALAASAS